MATRPPPPPVLVDDIIIEILLRLHPDDTACLARASLVCKPWRRLLSDRAFLRRYREIHGAAPVLGFLYNDTYCSNGTCHPLFIPTTPASPLSQSTSAAGSPTDGRILDCRHGRVLLQYPGYPTSLTVWDPVTGKQQIFDAPVYEYVEFTAAVLCTSNGCDHLDCSSGPFFVVLVEKTYRDLDIPWYLDTVQASLYSSETGKWRVSASIDIYSFPRTTPSSLLAGDTDLFFMVGLRKILKCDLARAVLSVISVPLPPNLAANATLCRVEDGGPGVAVVECGSLRLLSWRTNPDDGITKWVLHRVIKLDSMIPTGVGGHIVLTNKCHVVGFAEGTSYIFVWENDSIFSVELKSSRISKIGSGKKCPIFPFMRFYIFLILMALSCNRQQGLSDQCKIT